MLAGGLAALLLLAGGSPPLSAPEMLGFFDAATLGRYCTAVGAQAADGQIVCLSYISGAVDQLLAEQAMGAPGDRTICIPGDITAQAVTRTVTAYASWTRSAKGISAANFVRHAMEQAYPCQAGDARIM